MGETSTLPDAHKVAGLRERFVAQVLDTAIGFLPLLACAIGAFALGFDDVFKGWIIILGVLFIVVYVLFADGMSGGQSWGKKLLSIAVVDQRTGAQCSYGQSFVRNFTLLLLSVIDWIFIFGAKRQRLGDKLAHTEVVYVRRS